MALPEYLKNNLKRIENLAAQDLGDWSVKYDAQEFKVFDVMSELNREFPKRKILREDIVKLFEGQKLYLAFIAAMVWGFIDASRPEKKGGGKITTNFYRVLSHDKTLVLNAINNVQQHLRNENFVDPFDEMGPGNKHKIPGIGYRYYTKIFFFLGQSDEQIKIKPLIFDKWTSNAFFALLSQSKPECVKKYFLDLKLAKKQETPGEVLVRSGSKLTMAYESYVLCMNEWASELCVPPDKLEQFVFGNDLRRDKSPSNPRRELWNIAISNADHCGLKIKNANK